MRRALQSLRVTVRISLRTVCESVCAGRTHAASPEWMPASSMCSWMPPMKMSRPSATTCTSISVACPKDPCPRTTSAQRPCERQREVDRRLAAKLKDDPVRVLLFDDVQNVLDQERFEVQARGDVEVGGDRLRVVVRNDRGDALLPQREDALDAAIVELDALADPDGSTADNQDLASFQGRRLARRLVRRIEVWRPRLEFAAARVHHLVRDPRSTPTDHFF